MDVYEKLRLNKEFKRAYGRGRSFVTPSFVAYIYIGKTKGLRLGLTTGKKLGNAVQRNRARRVLTAAFRDNCADIVTDCDIVFVARHRILCKKSTEISAEMKKIFREAGITGQ